MHTYVISYDSRITKNVLWILCTGNSAIDACMNLFNVIPEAVQVTGCEFVC